MQLRYVVTMLLFIIRHSSEAIETDIVCCYYFQKRVQRAKAVYPKTEMKTFYYFQRGFNGFMYRPTRALWLPIRRQTIVEGSGTTATAARRRFSARRSSVDR